MLRGIILSSLNFRFLVVVIAAAVLVTGVTQLRSMPVDFLPEFSPPYVEIQTEALGLSAKEVEQLITVPMEQNMLNGVAWLDFIRSESVPGLSSIRLYFEPGTDIYQARQMVAERLTQAHALPQVSKPPVMIQPLSSTSRIMIVGLSSKELSLIELSVLARWTISPRLMGVPGVANVAIWGQRERQLQVQVDPDQLRTQGVSLQQILRTTGNALWVSPLRYLEASTPGTGGFIDTPNQRLGIWHVLPIASPEDLAQVPVEGASGLRLGDVATVVEDHQLLIGDALVQNGPNLLLVINKFPGSNTLEVTRGVEEALAVMQPGLGGVEIDSTIFRPASFIEMATANFSRLLLFGMLLMAAVLFAFLYEWRVALISLVVIPLALLAAALVLYQRGLTLNTMTAAGLVIALGIVIHDAISDMENVAQRLRERNGKATVSVIFDALYETRRVLFFATLILGLAILPVFFLSGVSGSIFQPFAVAYLMALLVSMAVALTVTPALSLILLANAPLERHRSPIVPGLKRLYGRMLGGMIRTPRLAFVALALILAAGLAAAPFLQQPGLLPAFKEPHVLIQLDSMAGTSRAEMDRMVMRVGAELQAVTGVQNVGAHVGRAVFGDNVAGVNSAQIWVNVDPQVDYAATAAAIQEIVTGYPGLNSQVHTYLQQTLRQTLSGSSQAMVVRIFGEDLAQLRSQAQLVQGSLANIQGIVDLNVDLPVEEPTLEIKVDLARADRYGIKPGDVRRAAAAMFSGLQVGSLFEQQKVFDVVVWGTPDIRRSLNDMQQLLIDTPSGRHVRLGDVADVRVTSAPQVIKREGVSPYLDVRFNVQGRDLNAVMGEVQRNLQTVQFPLEYHAEILGEYTERAAAQQRILVATGIALAGIFLLLQAGLRSWRLAALVFLSLPVALAGAVPAMLLDGGMISLGSLLGLLLIFGISVRNSLLLYSHYATQEDVEHQAFDVQLILQGASALMLPVITTTLILGLILAGFVFFGDLPGLEIISPMAIAGLGGLISSTIVTLFIMPVLYGLFGKTSREPDLGLAASPALEREVNY